MKIFLLTTCLACLAIVGYAYIKEVKDEREDWEPMNNEQDQTHNWFFV